MNIIDPILFHARFQPLAPAICSYGTSFQSVTYGRLAQHIHNVAGRTHQHGLVRGNLVALYIKDPLLHIVFILAMMKIGVVTLSGREPELPAEVKPDAIFADSFFPREGRSNVVVVDQSWAAGDGRPPGDLADGGSSLDDPCRLILTSGTTGDAKAVAFTGRQMLLRASGRQTVYGGRIANASRFYVDMGLSSGVGNSFLLYVLTKGSALFIRGSDRLIDTLEGLAVFGVDAIIGSPRGLADIAELSDKLQAFAAGLDVVVSSGSMLSRTLAEQLRAQVCSNLVAAYGSTEGGVTAAAPASLVGKIEGAVGFIVPGMTVDIVDAAGDVLPPGKEGQVRVRGDTVADGYVGDPAGMRSAFRGGGFCPGDVGVVTPDGMLVIAGREQSVINLGGNKVNPERVEAALVAFAGVRDAAVFPITTPAGVPRLGGAIVWRGEADLPGLREHLRQRLPPHFIPELFVTIPSVPRNASGKIDRSQLKQVLSGAHVIDERPLSGAA
jgi:acyl-coenzyme A synthetase/AMP-(fatty) acid ligase